MALSLRIGAIMSQEWYEPFEESMKSLGISPIWLADAVSKVPRRPVEYSNGLVIELSHAVIDVTELPIAIHSSPLAGLAVVRESESLAYEFGIRSILRTEKQARSWLEAITSSAVVSPPPLIAIWGAPGAPGATSLAISLSRELSRHQRAALIDADFVAPSHAELLGVSGDARGLLGALRVARNSNSPWEALLGCATSVGGSEQFLVLPGMRPGSLERMEAGAMSNLLHSFRQSGIAVVVEAKCVLSPSEASIEMTVVETVFQQADHLYLVGEATELGVSRLVRDWKHLASLPTEASRTLVLRKPLGSPDNSLSEAREALWKFTGCQDIRLVSFESDDDESVVWRELLQRVRSSSTLRLEGKSEIRVSRP